MFFDQTFKNLKRAREIASVALKYGFEDIVLNTPLRKLVPQHKRENWMRENILVFETSRHERLRRAFEELGPTFIKLAQVLSNRPDILPAGLIAELSLLQSDVAPLSFKTVKQIIEIETGKPIDDTFSYFKERPIGSASIGQVHRARLLNGKDVVVKIQRPHVRRQVATDLSILRILIERSEGFFERNEIMNPEDILNTFEQTINRELDYMVEARNMQTFRDLLQYDKSVYIPKVFKYMSTSKMLVMDYVSGCKITDTQQLKLWNLDPKAIVTKGVSLYLKQIFDYGIFHADPHPGNILIRQDGVICLLDFGMIGYLMKQDKYAFSGFLLAMAQRNARSMALQLRRLTIEDNVTDMRALENDLNRLIQDIVVIDVSDSNMSEFANQLQNIFYTYKLRIPHGIFLVLRSFVILEGIGKSVYPEFETYNFFKPYGLKVIAEQANPQNLSEELIIKVEQFSALLTAIPREIRSVLLMLRKGDVSGNLVLPQIDEVLLHANKISNRLSLALIIFAVIIGSSILALADFPEKYTFWLGLSYHVWLGYAIAFILTLILIIKGWLKR